MSKPRHKSKTNLTAMAIAVIGVIEMNASLLRPLLGDYYGVAFIAISIVMVLLREFTKEPIKK